MRALQIVPWLLCGLLTSAGEVTAAESRADLEAERVLVRMTDHLLAGELAMPQRPLDEALSLARSRASLLRQLLREQPVFAHRMAAPASLRLRVRAPVAELIEELWYGFATVSVYADMDSHPIRLEMRDGRQFDAYVSGDRAALQSKIDLPVAAVLLGESAYLAAGALHTLPEREIQSLLSSGLLSEVRAGRDLATGAMLNGAGTVAVVGDRVVRFQRPEGMRAFAARLREEEARLGPFVRTEALLDSLDAAPDSTGIEFPVDESPWTETPKAVLLIIADFADLQDPQIEQADLQARLNGSMTDAVREFSHGATWLTGDVSPKVTLATVGSYDFLHEIRADAFAAFEALNTGLDPADYDLLGVAFPQIGFNWAGIASIGGTNFSINGHLPDSIYVHEIGHNYGLEHASLWQTADGSVVGPLDDSDPNLVEYGNFFDVMGWGAPPEAHFTVHGKQRMDWVTDPLVAEVTAGNGQYRVYASDHADSDESPTLALRTPKCGDGHYWVEVRTKTPVGTQTEYEGSSLERGVLVSWQLLNATRTYLLNFGPGPAWESALEAGRTWSDPDDCVHITPLGKGGSEMDTWADVQINLDTAGNQAPSATISLPPAIHTRVHTRLLVDASDPNGDDLAYYWQVGDRPSENTPFLQAYWETPFTEQISVTVSDMKGGVATPAPTISVVEPLASGWSNEDIWPDTHVWEEVHSDGNQLVAVGGSSWVARSTDGSNWTLGSVPGEFVHFQEVNKLGAYWVAQGLRWDWNLSLFKEAVFYSADGLIWYAAFELAHEVEDVRDMACNGTSCVAVGLSGVLLRTTNGVEWQRNDLADRHSLYNVVWNGTEYRATGYLNQVGPVQPALLTSSDGLTWSAPVNVECLATPLNYVNGAYYGNCNNELQRSANAVNYEPVQAGFALEGMESGNGVMIATGWDFSHGWRRLISADGSDWHPLLSAADRERGLAFHGNRFIVAGHEGLYRSPTTLLDSDRDGIPDQTEQSVGLDPNDLQDAWLDLDGDGLLNQYEQFFGTHIGLPDTDSDGLSDGDELAVYGTSPTRRDTDLDTFSDGDEIAAGSDPLDQDSCPGAECYQPGSNFLLKILPLILEQQASPDG